MVRRNLASDALETCGVKTDKRYSEAAPHLLLELGHHGFERDDEDALGGSATDKLRQEDASFQRLAETDGIGDEYSRTRVSVGIQCLVCGLKLIIEDIHRRMMCEGDLPAGHGIVPRNRFNPEARLDCMGRRIKRKLRVLRTDDLYCYVPLSIALRFGPEYLVAPLDWTRHTANVKSLSSDANRLDPSDEPFRIADLEPHPGAECHTFLRHFTPL